MNVIHAWWPAGIVIGGLSGLALGAMDADWKIKLTATLVPAVMLAVLCFFVRFPLTERAASGISFGAMLAVYFFMPIMGRIYDSAKIEAAGGLEAFNALSGDELNDVLVVASQTSFRSVALLPLILLLVFGAIWIYDVRKGVKIEVLSK